MKKYKVMMYGFYKYRNLLKELVTRDIKVRYRKSALGLIWTVLNPLMMMMVMTLVFSTLFKSNIPNFPVYYLTGSLVFSFNSEASTQALYSILSNSSLIRKVYIPKYLFPLSRVMSSLVNFIFAYAAMVIVMLITHCPFYYTLLLTPVCLFYLFLFTSGLSLLLSAMTVFFRDLGHLYSVFILAWMYCTPIFYPEKIIPESYRFLIDLNPLYYYIEYFRSIVLYGRIPSMELNAICAGIGVGSMILGLIVFYKKQDQFILHL